MAASQPLAGRIALVTGAGRGIGRAHALALSGHGATVVVNDIGAGLDGRGQDESVAAAVVAEIEQLGGRAFADTTDVASVAGGRRAVDATVDRCGRIDILVNNAGFAHGGGNLDEPDEAGILALFEVHLMAAIGTMSASLADMQSRGWGRIINTVSEVALDNRFPGSLGYSTAKAALWSATLCAAAEGAPRGVTVNAISPGARTRMNETLVDSGFRAGRFPAARPRSRARGPGGGLPGE
jgi:NAD(P)-dependent dehydrogenase (short-subunit alcohol dehydrogenase family)